MAPVAPSSPGLFTADSTGHGQAAGLNQDGTANSATNPAHVGDVIVLYATGEGQTSPAGIDGQPASAPAPVLPLKVTIGKGRAQTGGGALPRSTIQSTTLDITHSTLKPQELAARLRLYTPPIVGYIERGQFKLDLRTVFAHQDSEIVAALKILN